MRTFTGIFEPDELGGYSARCLEIPGANSQGETLREAKDNLKDAIREILAYRAKEEEVAAK